MQIRHLKSKQLSNGLIFAMIVIGANLSAQDVYAGNWLEQFKPKPTQSSASPPQTANQMSRAEEFKGEPLKEPPKDLPDLPQYTGKLRFVGGFRMPNTRGGPSINLIFHSDQEAIVVLDWYKQALQSYGWTVINPREFVVSGNKNHNTCDVIVSPLGNPVRGMKTQININYLYGAS